MLDLKPNTEYLIRSSKGSYFTVGATYRTNRYGYLTDDGGYKWTFPVSGDIITVEEVTEERPTPITPGESVVKPTGGPSSYYDFPFDQWTTTNDMMEYLAEEKWGSFSISFKDVFKALCRWGDKDGTNYEYDARKIIYYGCRVLRKIVGTEGLRSYLQELLDDEQFK